MQTQSIWRTTAFAACVVVFGCSRTPSANPEKSVEAAPATPVAIAALPPGEPSDPSLVNSKVTANLETDAPWTDSRKDEQQASVPAEDAGPQANAPARSDDQKATAPQSDEPSAAASPEPSEQTRLGAAKSGDDEAPRTSTN